MRLQNILVETRVVRPGMTVADVFRECAEKSVQALPFCPEDRKVEGRLTLKNIMKFACIPEYLVELADVLGNSMSCLEDANAKAREVLTHPVEPYVLPPESSIDSDAPVINALAKMEKHDASYIFVVDEGVYQGIVTIQGVAKRILELAQDTAGEGTSCVYHSNGEKPE